jgi:signal transduction histidine kinase
VGREQNQRRVLEPGGYLLVLIRMSSIAVSPTGWLSAPLFRWSIAILAALAAGILVFETLDISIFRRIGMPHEFCYLRDPKLVWLHVVTDALIGAAYVSISLTLGYLVHKASRGIPFHWIFLAFGLFIVSCGVTHFMEVWVIWEPVYWMSGFVKTVTATASVATAVALIPLVPKIFRLIESARESERRRVEIEDLNKELERFNYSVAHDLRAPLRNVVGFAQAVREDYPAQTPPGVLEYVERMEKAAGRMDALISSMLRYATVGRGPLALQPVDVRDVVDDTLGLLASDIAESGAAIVVPEWLPKVQGDPILIREVLQNLIGNSLKFVAPGVRPRVEVSAVRENGNVVLFVTDNGVGIPEYARQKVFELFERGQSPQPGTGIGLAIVQRAMERLMGDVAVEDAPGGRGTRFRMRFRAAD